MAIPCTASSSLKKILFKILEECQLICNVVYGGVCHMYHYNNKDQMCKLAFPSVENHVRYQNIVVTSLYIQPEFG